MVDMDFGEVLSDSISLPPLPVSPPIYSSSSTSPRRSTPSVGINQQPTMQALEREFQQVRKHIKRLVIKKAKILRAIHNRKHYDGGKSSRESEGENINMWKVISARYLYARGDTDNGDKNALCFPIFNILPSEVLLHIFSYLHAKHLCQSITRVCALFCTIALDETLWKPLYCRSWGDHRVHIITNSGGSVTWRSLFGHQARTERNWWRGNNTINSIMGHKGAVRCLQFSGDTLITGSADKTIKIWNLNDGHCTDTLHDNKWIRCLRYDASSSTLVTTGMDSTLAKLWNLTTNTVSHVLDVHRGWITCLQLNMPRLVTGSLDGTIRVWDASTGQNQPNCIVHSGHDSLRSLCLSGDLVLSAGLERGLQLWDLRVAAATSTAIPVMTVEGAPHGNYCAQFDLHSHIVCSGSNSIVAVSDLRMPSCHPSLLRGHTDVVSCLQFVDKKLVTGSMDHTIRVWDLNTHLCASTLRGHDSWVWDLQFDPDKVVTASGDQAVKLWAFNHTYDKSAM